MPHTCVHGLRQRGDMLQHIVEHDDVEYLIWVETVRKITVSRSGAGRASDFDHRRVRLEAGYIEAKSHRVAQKEAEAGADIEQVARAGLEQRTDSIKDHLAVAPTDLGECQNAPLFIDWSCSDFAWNVGDQVRGKEPTRAAAEQPFAAQMDEASAANGARLLHKGPRSFHRTGGKPRCLTW